MESMERTRVVWRTTASAQALAAEEAEKPPPRFRRVTRGAPASRELPGRARVRG